MRVSVERCCLVERYHSLLACCEEQRGSGFDEQAQWLRRALAALEGLREGGRKGGSEGGREGGSEGGLSGKLLSVLLSAKSLRSARASGGDEKQEGARGVTKRQRGESGGVDSQAHGFHGKQEEQENDEEEEGLPLAARVEKRMKKCADVRAHFQYRGKCRAKRAASQPPAAAALRTRARRHVPIRLEAIRDANPQLEDEQGPRAHLGALNGLSKLLVHGGWREDAAPLKALDRVVDALCGAAADNGQEMWERTSRTPASPRDLQLFTLDVSPEMLAAALFAGFFPFASEFAFPGRPLQERGLINLELGGPEVDRREGDPGGRLVLDLSDGSTDRLVVGKRCIKTVRAAVSSEDAPAAGHAPAGTAYRLTVCAAFERAWQQVVAHHGVDWCGFSAIQAAYHALHEHGQRSASRSEEANAQGIRAAPRVISVELWDTSRLDELVSAEIGVIVGRCYVCVSLFSRNHEYPRSDAARLAATVLWLRRAGVELFDAGTTAKYFASQYGYRRCASRRDFTDLWRSKRTLTLSNPRVLSEPCADVRGLLETYQQSLSRASAVCLECRVATPSLPHSLPHSLTHSLTHSFTHSLPPSAVPASHRSTTRKAKHSVRISGLPPGVSEARLRTALAQVAPAVALGAIERLTIVEHLGAAFVTVVSPAHVDVLLGLDGGVLPLTEAPAVQVVAHGRRDNSNGAHRKRQGTPSLHTSPTT